MPGRSLVRSAEFRIAATYAGTGLAWVWLSDRALVWLGMQSEDGFLAAAAKGSLFVLLSAALVLWLARREFGARERAKDELKARAAQLRSFVEQAPAALALFDRGMNYLAASRRWADDYGLGHRPLVGLNHYEVSPDLPERWRDIHRQALAGNPQSSDEDLWVQADGSRVWLRWAVRPWTAAGGEVGGVLILSEDVTARKAAEAALHDRTARLAAILNAAADAILTIDERGVIDSVNPATERLFGYPTAELVGRNVSVLMPPPYRDEHDGYLARYAATGVKRIIGIGREVVGRRKDGSVFPMDLTVSEVRDGRRWFTGIVRDISDRKRAEHELRAGEAFAHGVLDALAAHIAVLDPDGRIVAVNAAWEAFAREAGSDPRACGVGANYLDVCRRATGPFREEAETTAAAIRAVLVGSSDRGTLEYPCHGPTRQRWFAMVVTPLGPDRRGAVVSHWDITDRRRIEDELRASTAELETKSRLLLRSDKLASLGTLASGIAHDLNNVLTPVRMAVKLLLKDKPGLDRQALLATADASVERGAAIIRQLLTFGGGTPGAHAPVSVADLVREVRGMMSHALPKSIAVHAVVPADVWSACGDHTQLTQVLVNLCVNARDAMPDGGTIDIRAANEVVDARRAALQPGAAAGRYVVLSVTDTGHGIPAEVQAKMFDPFFTTKPFGQGTGLGLATLLGIVKSHGGFVNVDSEPGKGARFVVYVPATGDAAAAAADDAPAGGGRGEVILMADDEPHLLAVAATVLRQAGYRVVTAANGDEAVEAYRRHRGEVAAVVLDMMMPGTGGLAALRRIREVAPDTRFVVVSGLRPTAVESDELERCGAVFVPKPYSDDDLLAAIQSALARRT